MTIAICGIRFCYGQTLNRQWSIFGIVRPAPEKKLPVILGIAEVRQILSLIRLPRYKVCLSTTYSCGLRLQEGTNLHVADIDSARLMLHVRHGKGAKDRYLPLPERTLELLRQYWATHHKSRALVPPKAVTTSIWRRPLSPTTKKPASLAGFLYLILSIAHLNRSFPSRHPLATRLLSPRHTNS